MRIGHHAALACLCTLAACGGPALETRTIDLRYLDGRAAEAIVRPYVYTDRAEAPGVLSVGPQTITVRETRDNLERIERVLAEQDRPPVSVRLVFMIIQADGAGPVDTLIAPIETQLRRLFRFRGYRMAAQAVTVATERTGFRHLVGGGRDRYLVTGEVEAVNVRGDSGVVRVSVSLEAPAGGAVSGRLSIALNHTAVLGGQAGVGEGALILAVRPELAGP